MDNVDRLMSSDAFSSLTDDERAVAKKLLKNIERDQYSNRQIQDFIKRDVREIVLKEQSDDSKEN